MARTANTLEQFVALKASLEQERSALRKRLSEIERVLGSDAPQGAAASSAPPVRRGPGRPPRVPGAAPAAPVTGRRGRRPRNDMSMREAIAEVVKSSPKKIRDIVDGMESLGFRFKSKNPVNSVGAYLYGPEGKKFFRRGDGGFTVK